MTIINGTYEEMDSKPKSKFEEFIDEAKKKGRRAVDWAYENDDKIVAGATGLVALIGAATPIVKAVRKATKPISMYDHSLGKTLYLKRELHLEELQWIRERRAVTGESLYEVLKSMDVLSRKNKF